MDKTILLASEFTIEAIEQKMEEQNREILAEFVFKRLMDRYVSPIEKNNSIINNSPRNGFLLMAIACLLIETYQSFKKGWKTTKDGKSRESFRDFFIEETKFEAFSRHYKSFYECVRCGILHQGETTKGWKITRRTDSPIFDEQENTINAEKFFDELQKVLISYKARLKGSPWDSEIWRNCRAKIRYVIINCGGR